MGYLRIILVAVVVFAVALLFSPVVQMIGEPLVVKDPLRKADAVVVLSGGWENENKLSQSTLERYKYGMKLYQKGYGHYIIFSGGNMNGNPSEAEKMAEMALTDGFPNETIIIEGNSESTWENTLFVKKILLDRQLKTVILVTSPYHTLRAKTMFKEKGIDVTTAPVLNSEFFAATGTDNYRIARLIFTEYLKFGLYKLNIIR